MKNKIKFYHLLIVTVLLSVLFTNCQKENDIVLNDKIVIINTTVSAVTQVRATVRARITSDGGNAIKERGICYATAPNPTISGTKMKYDSTAADSFYVRLQNLTPNQKYYARPYAINNDGVGYGPEISFTTDVIKIGDLFEGGIVFYIDATGLKGLIAARQGSDYSSEWGCKGTAVTGTKAELGNGKANTLAITKICTTAGIAARFADELSNSSFNDWYLPSKDELTEMFKHRDVVVLNNAVRWSSSEVDKDTAWALSFDVNGNPVPVVVNKDDATVGVRAIRAFSL